MTQDNSELIGTPGRYQIFQIFYDDASRATIHPALIPLDNTDGRPDWFEFWPMVQFLRTTELDEDAWYGFLSPRFFEKLGISWDDVTEVLNARPDADVALFSSYWLWLATLRNPWVDGERFHPGLIASSEEFLRHRGINADLASVITDFDTAVHSNYLIGKPSFWRLWLDLANDYLSFVEAQDSSSSHRRKMVYRGTADCEMKVYVQERLATWILLNNPLIVTRPDYAFKLPFIPKREGSELITRWLIHICERSKHLARITKWDAPLLVGRVLKHFI